jgi:dTDP-4-dehydrorhamnose reductase
VLKKKVLVLGSTGLIGHQVYNYLQDNGSYELHNISYRVKLKSDSIIQDVRDEKKLVERITKIAPDYIINCVGVLIGGSEKNNENAIFLNSYFPHRLSRLADQIYSKLIHMSTDCVFSGKKGNSYIETDIPDGEGFYARTKALGEILNSHHLTLRTSVVGPELKSDGEELFHWFMSQSDDIMGFTKTLWSGVTSLELAKAVHWSIDKDISGLYHVTNNSYISKYEILELFKKYTRKDINIIPVDGNNLNKSFKDTRKLIDYEIPSYDQMIFGMVNSIAKQKALYSHYKI